MIQITNGDYKEYKRNCERHNIQPEGFVGWRLRADAINFEIAELMNAVE